MTPARFIVGALTAASVLISVYPPTAHAQVGEPIGGGPGGGSFGGEVVPGVDWETRLQISERLQPLGNDLFGDRIDPHTGSVDFLHTDIAIPGNSALEVALHRRNRPGRQFGLSDSEFGDWEYVVPRIMVVTADQRPWTGNRCTAPFNDQFTPLWTSTGGFGQGTGSFLQGHEYTNGVQLEVGGRSEPLLQNPAGAPWPSGASHVTHSNWYFTCLGNNNFLGRAPDGTTYRFDRHIVRDAMPIAMHGSPAYVHRDTHILAATEVTDAHGNWVRYDYDSLGRLTRIHANDGRAIDLAYTGSSLRVASATANGRTWTYTYGAGGGFGDGAWIPDVYRGGNPVLTRVDLPDGRHWAFEMASMQMSTPPSQFCVLGGGLGLEGGGITLTHPSGAQGVFHIEAKNHRIAFHEMASVLPYCPEMDLEFPPTQGSWPVVNTAVTPVHSLIQKTISGPDLPTAVWTYEYEQDMTVATESDNRTNWTRVTGPHSVVTFYHRWRNEPEGGAEIWREVRATPSGPVLERIDTSYIIEPNLGAAGPSGGGGITLNSMRRQTASVVRNRGGDVYTTEYTYVTNPQASNYSFGFPVQTRIFSNLPGATERITQTTYQHLTSPWVLGLPSQVVRNGRTVYQISYNAKGQPTTINRFGFVAETRSYNGNGTLAWVRDPLNRQTSFANYHRGQARTITRPDSVQILVTVDNNGWITGVTNARGFTTTYSYNQSGWLTAINRPSPQANTTITYNGLIQTINTGTVRETVTHDAFYRPILVRRQALSGGGGSIFNRTVYDAEGRVVFASYPSASAGTPDGMETTHDALGRVTLARETAWPFPETATAYLSNNRVQVTDPSGAITTTTRSGYASPDDGETLRIDQPEGVVTEMAYNSLGSLISATQSGGGLSFTQTWAYDNRERVCRHVTPETGATLYLYNVAHQVSALSRGEAPGAPCGTLTQASRINYMYDSLGRVATIGYPSGTPNATLSYDANSNLTQASRGGTVWSYVYDNADRLTRETLAIDGRSYQTDYAFNPNGALVSQTTPGGRTVSYQPDGLGRATRASDAQRIYASNAAYHPSGGLSALSYGNGLAFSASYNARQLMTAMQVSGGGVTAISFVYGRDPNGRITSISDLAVSGQYRTFGYDQLGRLTTATGPWGSGSYTYDALNNITSRTLGSRVVEMQYDASNRLHRHRDTADGHVWRNYAYDSRGNVTNNGSISFTYDRAERPVSISGGASGSFVYDAHGRRVKQVTGGQTIYSVYSASGTLLYRDNATTSTATDYIRMGGRAIARVRGSHVEWTHADHLGSPAAATSLTGAVLWREDHTPFGEARQGPTQNVDNEGFTGHIADAATGLVYMQARYYDPLVGRFLSNDPVGFVEGGPAFFNRYAYAYNDPVNHIDPDGELAFVIPVVMCASNPVCRGAVGGAFGGAVGAGASVISQAMEGGGFDLGRVDGDRVAIDAGKGAITGAVSGATMNSWAGAGTAAALGGADGAHTAANDGDRNTTAAGGFVRGALTEGASALVGGRVGGYASPVKFPTGEGVGVVAGAVAGPPIARSLGEPAGNAVDSTIRGVDEGLARAHQRVNRALNERNMCEEHGC